MVGMAVPVMVTLMADQVARPGADGRADQGARLCIAVAAGRQNQ